MILQKYKPENKDLFLRERIGLLQDSLKEDAKIRLRAAKYHLNTELYNLTLPGYFSRHNEWIPRGDFLSSSRRNAVREREYQIDDLSTAEIKKFQLYSQDYARLSVEEIGDEIEGLNRILNA